MGVLTLFGADVFDSLSSFFDSPLWTVAKVLITIFLVLLWLFLAYWVYRDARRRNRAPGFVRLMTLFAIVIPYLGPLLYLAVRPSETIEESRERQLELIALERQAALRCPDCGYPGEARFLACSSCMRKLREPCAGCGEPIDPRWSICPYCEKVPAGALSRVPQEPGEVSY